MKKMPLLKIDVGNTKQLGGMQIVDIECGFNDKLLKEHIKDYGEDRILRALAHLTKYVLDMAEDVRSTHKTPDYDETKKSK